jgi:hypothetical protein
LTENLPVALSVLSDDPSGFLWIITALNILTIVLGFRENMWRTKTYKAIVFMQLLIIPVAAVIGFHFATQPPA